MRAVSYQEAKDYANQHGLEYVESSAKTGYNVDLVFEKMTK